MKRVRRRYAATPLYVLAGIIGCVILAHVWIDRLYDLRLHVALGYGSVYSRNMVLELATHYGGACLYALLVLLALRPFREVIPPVLYGGVKVAGFLFGWVVGYGMWSLNPTTWYLFFRHQSFGVTDPLFHLDESFYVYVLPVWFGVIGRVVATLLLFAALRLAFVAVAFLQQQVTMTKLDLVPRIRRQTRVLLLLGSGLFLCFAVLTALYRYQSAVTSSKGQFIFGPDFVAARLGIPIFSWIHIVLLLLVALSLIWLSVHPERLIAVRDGFAVLSPSGLRRPMYAFSAYVGAQVLTAAIGGIVGALYVHPNENTVELPYIKNSIDATRWAFGVDKVQVQPFTPIPSLSAAAVAKDTATLDNARVNDQGQTTTIYDQLQSFKNYFSFSSSSVDRYAGNEVYVSARQMDVDKLPVQTWVNRTLVYTHGYGVAISPVNQFDADGLPTMWAKDTPQQTQPPLPSVTEPRIYFGLMSNNVIAPSKQQEFDYPVGAQDQSSHYAGGDGLPIVGNRWLLALKEGTLKFFTSDQITPQSQWLFDRNIYQRVQDIAPFLRYDKDAFPFIDGQGHVQWMLDAYTTSSNIPYAQNFMDTAYIRNSVKVVMDAYTGKTTFYVIDPSDPMVQSLMQTYPKLFTTQVPADIAAHFRYPTDLFQAQASALTRYHMTEATAFYNQEDLWDVAHQIYQQNQTADRPPVYQMVRMPGRTKPEFVLSSLFTPHSKDNLNGWLVADNGDGRYGQLTLYQFPQSSLIFGPMQAENQIDSNPQISSQLTLWNQQGSHVVRGDLLLIPVGDALVYVEPIYLVANRENSLPQLERVIVDFNQQVYINTSLGAAITDLLHGTNAATPQPNAPGQASQPGQVNQPGTQTAPAGTAVTADLANQANQWFQQYEADTAKGDLAAAGKDLQKLGEVLAQMKGLGRSTAQGSH